jgi:site-specific recombinase XerC
MTVRKLDPKTQANYLRSVKRFADFLGRSPAGASAEDLRRFQLQLVGCGTGTPTCNATLTALRFFFEVTVDRTEVTAKARGVREPRRLPVVLFPSSTFVGHFRAGFCVILSSDQALSWSGQILFVGTRNFL